MIRSALNASKLAQRVTPRSNGAIRTMAGKEIKFGVEGRAAMLRGVDLLADAVQVRASQGSHGLVLLIFGSKRQVRMVLYI